MAPGRHKDSEEEERLEEVAKRLLSTPPKPKEGKSAPQQKGPRKGGKAAADRKAGKTSAT